MEISKENFSTEDIPKLSEILDYLKAEKAKTIVPKFEVGQKVHRSGYQMYSGEIWEIDIEIKDSGKPLITYTIEGVGTAWESELELTTHPYNGPMY